MKRRTFLFAAALAAILLAAPPVLADGDKDKDGKGGQKDKDKDKKEKEKEKDPKDSAEWKECAAIGRQFESKDAAGLADRVPEKGKVTIALGESGEYAAKQASGVLEDWFKGKKNLEVKMKSITDTLTTATLEVSWNAAGSDRKVERKLYVTIRKRAKGEGFVLTKLELSS